MRRTVLVLAAAALLAGGCAPGQREPTAGEPGSIDPARAATVAVGAGLVTAIAPERTVGEAVERISSDIVAAGGTVIATVDHAAAARGAGLELPPTTVVIFGNPQAGTPLMQASQTAGIDLPQKLLVYESEGQTMIAFNDPSYLARRHGIDGQDQRLAMIRQALERLATGS